MNSTRRTFFKSTAVAQVASGVLAQQPGRGRLNGFQIARRHPMIRTQPTPDFFEGLLLGNGDVGVCVTVRPDALGLHIGKGDAWDIRVSEEHASQILPFKEFLKLWERAGQEAKRQGKPEMLHLERNIDFFRKYTDQMHASYNKRWPRPWPCGIVWLHWDSRMVRVLRQLLDPSTGFATIDLEHDDLKGTVRRLKVLCFVNQETGHVSVSTSEPAPFLSAAYYPFVDTEVSLPDPELAVRSADGLAEFTCYQLFPATAPTTETPNPPKSDKDRNFALCARLSGAWKGEVEKSPTAPRVFLKCEKAEPLRLDLTIFTPRDMQDNVAHAPREAARLASIPVPALQQASEKVWRDFWSKSAVEMADAELEKIWYHNQYFLRCCLKPGSVAPGLFGNWTSGRIGTAWHGDYHLDYNAQQVYWGVFSSNHPEQHLPYVELIENLQPMVKAVARDHFEMPGAFYPVSVYPVPSMVNPYPAPPWFYMICDAPWAVQSLWWQYLYTQDRQFLDRAYPMLADVARFLCAYMKKGDDGRYHVIPTVSSENWGCTVDFRLNRDATMDLAFGAFVLNAAIEGSKITGKDAAERARWADVLANLAPYPKAAGPFGEVWLDVADAPVEHVYNVPATPSPVFPGDQVGIGVRPELLEIARRTTRTVRLEGGNDIVYQPMIRARLGMLDLNWFKREVRYCMLPNGTAFDRVRQIGGRYRDSKSSDYMARMGVWVENFSLPGVINECMLQSYSGVIHLFPNTRNLPRCSFSGLRAVGAFLVSAAWSGAEIFSPIELTSEMGARCRLAKPWGTAKTEVFTQPGRQPVPAREVGGILDFATEKGARYLVERTG